MPQLFPTSPHGAALCSLCGQRPGVVRMMTATGAGRGTAVLCPVCAEQVSASPERSQAPRPEPASATPALDSFGRDLSVDAREGRIDPVVGRAAEIERDGRDPRPSPQEQRRADRRGGRRQDRHRRGPRPAHCRRRRPRDAARTAASSHSTCPAWSPARSTAASSSSASRPRSRRSSPPRGRIVLFVDEAAHDPRRRKRPRARMDAANMLKPLLARGELRVIGATTLAEYRADRAATPRWPAASPPSWSRRPPSRRRSRSSGACAPPTRTITARASPTEALAAAARLSDRYITEHQPTTRRSTLAHEWNAQQTDATLVRGGKQVTVGGQTWIYPSGGQCMECHTDAAGRSLGLETRQLAFNIRYPQTGRDAHQLVTLNAIHTLTPPIANPTDGSRIPIRPERRARWRASARVPAHQLRAVSSPGGANDLQHGSALRDRTRGHPRMRRRARGRRPRHHRRAAHRAGRPDTLCADCTHEPARRTRHAARRISAGGCRGGSVAHRLGQLAHELQLKLLKPVGNSLLTQIRKLVRSSGAAEQRPRVQVVLGRA